MGIAKNQDVQQKIYAEMKESGRDLHKSPFLFACIKESMRLHPVQPNYSLSAAEPGIEIGGYDIPEGVNFTCVTSNTALNGTYFEDPLVFRPERWLAEEKPHPFASCPYGIGDRACPASKLGDIQLAVLVQELLRKFVLDSDPEDIVEAQFRPLLVPITALDIAFNERNPNNPKAKQ